MSAEESAAATVRRIRSFGDLPSPSPEVTPAPNPSGSHVHLREPEAPPPPQAPAQHSSITRAVLENWPAEQPNFTTGVQAAGLATPPPPPNPPQAPLRDAQESWMRNTLSFMGIGRGATPARKSEMSLLWNLCWGLAQVAVVSTLAALTGTIWKSETDATVTEWQACDRPLGVWACLWIVRVVLASGLAYWDFVRTKIARQLQPTVPSNIAGQMAGNRRPGQSLPQPTHQGQVPFDPENPPAFDSTDPLPPVHLPWSRLYSRLTLFSSLLTLSWFLTAHILEYTSLNSCRHTSPHLWWLIFGILCIMYVMVLEVLLLGFIVLVLAPILFVFWNIFLFCIGRHPAQNPHMIKPDIGKLPKSLVDRIPLVMYIPPPPGNNNTKDESGKPILHEDGQHEYPPKSPATPAATTSPPKKSRFRFFKKKSSKEINGGAEVGTQTINNNESPTEEGEKEHETWEGNFERSEYPFVVLEGNRAACAICLMDFEEPKRREAPTRLTLTPLTSHAGTSTSPSPISTNGEDAERELKLTDAGEGAQPLRLLACGHVFHQTCLDPWLTDVSGRCPVCQRPVEARELKKKKRGNR